jgi:hypothetical protein
MISYRSAVVAKSQQSLLYQLMGLHLEVQVGVER